jgi:hypothetical protein
VSSVCFQDAPDGDESDNQFAGEVEEKWVEVGEEENNVHEFDTISTRVAVGVWHQYRTENNVLPGYRKTYSMSSAHPCQKSRHVLTTCVQRQLEWGLTVAVHGMYIRAMLDQHARTLDRPISRCATLLLPP